MGINVTYLMRCTLKFRKPVACIGQAWSSCAPGLVQLLQACPPFSSLAHGGCWYPSCNDVVPCIPYISFIFLNGFTLFEMSSRHNGYIVSWTSYFLAPRPPSAHKFPSHANGFKCCHMRNKESMSRTDVFHSSVFLYDYAGQLM